jgi:signal transduction histidine kinase
MLRELPISLQRMNLEGPQEDEAGEGRDAMLLEELERLEQQFEELRAQLTHSHRLATVGTLASVVAHEYNNLLTPVINYAQMALKRPEDPELMRKALQRSLEGAQRATRISNSLLGFAGQDEDKAANLPATADEAVTCLAREPGKDGVALEVDLPDVAARISPLNLQQVLVNLILNAKKAMQGRGGRVVVRGESEGSQVRVEVADDGPGIPANVRGRLFEPFVTESIDESGSEKQSGTGLGLCICRDLVEGSGGSINVTSEEGGGTTFYIRLPRADAFEAGEGGAIEDVQEPGPVPQAPQQ